jgi:hypothetical protein
VFNLIGRQLSRVASILLIAVLTALPVVGSQASIFDQFIDEDGWFDSSDWVLDNTIGFMPVPIVITEPAIGEGLGLVAAFFHPPKGYSKEQYEQAREKARNAPSGEKTNKKFVLPNVTAVAAAGTNNDSWFAGGGHFAHWKDDTIRYRGVLGYGSVNLEFFGLAGGPLENRGLAFNGEGRFIDQPISFRLGDSDFFLGGGYKYLDITTEFDINIPIPGFPPLRRTTQLSGLRVFLDYDNRDSIFTPSEGANATLSYERNDEAIGSDFDYDFYKTFGHKYWTLNPRWVLGLRGDLRGISGRAPFYVVPYIDLRGIPVMRYQGEAVAVGETEVRWNFHPRISAVGFLGFGRAAEEWSDIDDATTRDTQGLGIRYYFARKLGMFGGVDVAHGPEDTYWYITMGSAWE